jgi:trk system potassium uptake protein TrkH
MQFAGGAGVAVIFIAAIGGPLGPGLALAEGRADQLVPHVRHSMALVVRIYTGYAVLGFVGLRLAGMSSFDALNHCFAAVSTGGFSTHAESIGYWDSPAVESVTLVLMLLGSTNFQTAYLLLKGRGLSALRNAEVRTFTVLVAVMIPLLYVLCSRPLFTDPLEAMRVAVFEIVSAATTTGFSTTTYSGWPAIGVFLLLPLMVIGGGSGSTAGGMKQWRVYVLVKSFVWELRRMALPRSVVLERPVWRGEELDFLRNRTLVQVASFVTAYVAIYVVGTGVLVAAGFGITESLFEYGSALGTVGLSVGVTNAEAPISVLWAEIAGMFLGRLEIFVVLLALRQGLELRRAR